MQGMKKVVTGLVLGASVVVLGAGGVMAAAPMTVNTPIGSASTATKVENSTIVNKSEVSGGTNLAIGKGSTAVSGSNVIENGANVKDSTIVNSSKVSGGTNLSIGEGATAASGSNIVK
jgi:NDP-sugar pyrophosphorylase family protein